MYFPAVKIPFSVTLLYMAVNNKSPWFHTAVSSLLLKFSLNLLVSHSRAVSILRYVT